MKQNLYILICIVLILLAGCSEDMQHTNPYDPETTMATFLEQGFSVLEVDNTLKAADSPYFIDKNLTVRAQLTIEPGVILQFSPGIGMTIDGSSASAALIAVGTEDAPIVFTSAGTQDWAGVSFNHLQTTSSILKYCRFEYASRDLNAYAITTADDSLTIENCEFYGANIMIDGFGEAIARPVIKHCNFGGSYIEIWNGAKPRILYNHFIGMYPIRGRNGAAPEIGYNIFGPNESSYETGGCSFLNSTAHIYRNSFMNIGENAVRFRGGCNGIIEYNDFSGGTNGIHFRTTNDPGINTTPENNKISIRNNNFSGYTDYHVSLYIIGGTGEATQTGDIDAVGNYWGTTDSTAIENALYDRVDDGELGKVIFSPYLNTPVLDAGAGW